MTETLIIHDKFTDIDGTLLPDHIIDTVNVPAVSWGLGDQNAPQIIGGRMFPGIDIYTQARLDIGCLDFKMILYWTTGSYADEIADALGFELRFENNGIPYAWAEISSGPHGFVNGGSDSQSFDESFAFTPNTTYKIEIEMIGRWMLIYIDNVEIGRLEHFTLSSYRGTICGIVFSNTPDQSIDDFKIIKYSDLSFINMPVICQYLSEKNAKSGLTVYVSIDVYNPSTGGHVDTLGNTFVCNGGSYGTYYYWFYDIDPDLIYVALFHTDDTSVDQNDLSSVIFDGAWAHVGELRKLAAGTGSTATTITATAEGLPIDGTQVQVATDSAFANVVASGYTTTAGTITFNLDAGSYYVRLQHAGYSWSDGTLTVT